MKRFIVFSLMLILGIWLIGNDTWQSIFGGLLIFMAGGISGEDSAKEKNKLSDHLRKETKR